MSHELEKNKPETVSENAPDTPNRFRQSIHYFADKGLDTAVKHIWTLIGGAAMTVLTTIAAYLLGAVWLYPYLIYALVFSGGIFASAFVIFCLTLLRIRKEKALEKVRLEGFISDEKGLLDHDFDLAKAQDKFPVVLGQIGSYLGQITQTIADSDYEFWGQMTPNERLKSASKIAANLLKHSKGMESHIKELKNVIHTIEESGKYVLLADTYNEEKFNERRQELEEILIRTQASIESMSTFRENQVGVKGISQDLNSSVNHLIHVTTEIIEILEQAKLTWLKLSKTLDEIEENQE